MAKRTSVPSCSGYGIPQLPLRKRERRRNIKRMGGEGRKMRRVGRKKEGKVAWRKSYSSVPKEERSGVSISIGNK